MLQTGSFLHLNCKKMSKNKEYKNIYTGFPDAALTFMLIIAAAFLALISYYAISCTYLIRRFEGQASVYLSDDPFKQLAVFGIFILAVMISGFLWDRYCKNTAGMADLVLVLSTFFILTIGFVFLKDHPYYMDGDQINTFYAGVYANDEGSPIQYIMFQPGGYIGIYPQQKGLVLIYYVLYKVFGEKMYDSLQYFHLLYPCVILHAGYHILKKENVSAFARSLFCIMVATCLPLYVYIPYMYGDLGSVAFSFCFALFFTFYLHTGKAVNILLMCIFGSAAVLLRMQSWILLIAAFIVLFLEYMKRRKAMIIIAGVCVIASAFLGSFSVQKFFEAKTGYVDVDGIPSVCWVAMGLQETEGNPGAYNRYNQGTFEECGFDADKTSDIAKENIRNTVTYMKENPEYARWFFSTKLKQEWTEPDLEAISMTSVWNELSGTDPSEAPEWLVSIYSSGTWYDKLINFANRYQTVCYLSAFCLVIIMVFKKRSALSDTVQLYLIYFIGGLLFFAVWENKSRYILPYFVSLVFMVPYFADALRSLVNFRKRR